MCLLVHSIDNSCCDQQILDEAMLEDINCLLGSGEVPNLFTADEEADIVVQVRDAVRANGTPDTRVSSAQCFVAEKFRGWCCCLELTIG